MMSTTARVRSRRDARPAPVRHRRTARGFARPWSASPRDRNRPGPGEVAAARCAEGFENGIAVPERAKPCRLARRPIDWLPQRGPEDVCRTAGSRPRRAAAERDQQSTAARDERPSRSAVNCATGTSLRITTDARCRSSVVSSESIDARRFQMGAFHPRPARASDRGWYRAERRVARQR